MNYIESKKEFLKETKKVLELYNVLYEYTMDNVGRLLELKNPASENTIKNTDYRNLISNDEDINKFERLMIALQFVEDPTNEEMMTYLLYLFNKSVKDKQNDTTVKIK